VAFEPGPKLAVASTRGAVQAPNSVFSSRALRKLEQPDEMPEGILYDDPVAAAFGAEEVPLAFAEPVCEAEEDDSVMVTLMLSEVGDARLALSEVVTETRLSVGDAEGVETEERES
jgi:hypothetical protein